MLFAKISKYLAKSNDIGPYFNDFVVIFTRIFFRTKCHLLGFAKESQHCHFRSEDDRLQILMWQVPRVLCKNIYIFLIEVIVICRIRDILRRL